MAAITEVQPDWKKAWEIADITGMSRAAIHRLRNRAESPLPSVQIGRTVFFDMNEVNAWLKSYETK